MFVHCTDGAASMTGRVKGFVGKVRELNPNLRIDHCLIHREAIVAKSWPSPLKIVMDEVVKEMCIRDRMTIRLHVITTLYT